MLAIAAVGAAYSAWCALYRPLPLTAGRPAVVEVAAGDTVHALLGRLAARGDIGSVLWYKLYLRQWPIAILHIGEYELAADARGVDLLAKLASGEVRQYSLTLVEGVTLRALLTQVTENTAIEDDISALTEDQFTSLIGLARNEAEGWFFPDTYQFVNGHKASALLRAAYLRMQAELARAWEQRADGLPYQTPYQLLIMASLIERETGAPQERATIAGVFVRRLQLGMKLQTDPTVIYGMGEAYQGRLQRADLQRVNDWNTYVIPALPKTPIAMPGRAALEAAARPQSGTALYFVAKGDGTHVFSDTLAAHNRAVAEYQKKRRSDYRSTYRESAP